MYEVHRRIDVFHRALRDLARARRARLKYLFEIVGALRKLRAALLDGVHHLREMRHQLLLTVDTADAGVQAALVDLGKLLRVLI